ncbi:hypothetical protein [Flavobacterium sp.]|uniref:hypothetical protein n=1 Tax=Flavobacterium sp. TaxID=239 RepID=UPI0026350CB6|nr:hypothetical protein [Flavobacterium sp.]
MKIIFQIIISVFLLLSCSDKKNIDKKEMVTDTVKSKKTTTKPKPKIDIIYDDGRIKLYGDTSIEKDKISWGLIKFEPYINFSDFKVEIQNVKAKIDLNSNELGREFRTAIRTDYENPKSLFAGHYSFSYWGCGSPCQMSVIIDRKTGKIYDSPTASLGYEFRNDSRMLIVNPPDSLGYYDNCSYCKPEI